MNDDAELLRRYAGEGANDAFAELVRRHVDLVYSAALRQLNGDAHLAADATQLVFADLARKAGALAGHRVLAGWLFTSTRFATAKLVRGERRRQAREQEAQLMQELTRDDPAAQLDWQRVRPVLDDVLSELSENDREAILLRFFEGRDYASVGAKLNLADNTARMRVERALDKLRALLERRGVTSTSAALAAALANQAVIAAPTGLAATVTGAALAGGAATAVVVVGSPAAVSGGISGVATFMSMTKVQLVIASAVVMAGMTGIVTQARINAALKEESGALRQQMFDLVPLRSRNEALAKAARQVAQWREDSLALAALQAEVAALRQKEKAAAARSNQTTVEIPIMGEIFDVQKLDRKPTPKVQPVPIYPAELRKFGIGGEVVVDFVVDSAGDVRNARVIRSTVRELEQSALEAVRLWKFDPGMVGERVVNSHLQMPLVYKMNPEEEGTSPRKGENKNRKPTFWF